MGVSIKKAFILNIKQFRTDMQRAFGLYTWTYCTFFRYKYGRKTSKCTDLKMLTGLCWYFCIHLLLLWIIFLLLTVILYLCLSAAHLTWSSINMQTQDMILYVNITFNYLYLIRNQFSLWLLKMTFKIISKDTALTMQCMYFKANYSLLKCITFKTQHHRVFMNWLGLKLYRKK